MSNGTGTMITIPNGDLAIAGYLALPVGDGPFPGVVVIQEVFGVNDHIQDVTRRLAAAGYGAIAPAIYQRQAPDFTAAYTEAGLAEGRKYKEQTTATELLSDIQATIAYLHHLPQIQAGPVGAIGFCFGGHVVYLAATLPDIAATASFYGAGIVNSCPGETSTTLDRTPQISGTIYGFFGTEDPLIPNDQVDTLEKALEKAEVKHKIFRYEGATHGFFCDQRDSYDPPAAADAWTQTLGLFAQTLPSL